LLTKKDVWYVLNGAEETRRTNASDGMTTGLTRDDGQGEERGLLGRDSEGDDIMPHGEDGDVRIL
jgi:chloride channel 3/4/5